VTAGSENGKGPTPLPFDLPPTTAAPSSRKRNARQRTAVSASQRVQLRWNQLGPSSLASQGARFGEWVAWLLDTYALWEAWPACWHRHAGLVEELTALWAWHVDLDADGDGVSAISWHAALYRFVDRSLATVGRRCLSSHQEATPDIVEARERMLATMRDNYAEVLARNVKRRAASSFPAE
jgi:hypothetical protein